MLIFALLLIAAGLFLVLSLLFAVPGFILIFWGTAIIIVRALIRYNARVRAESSAHFERSPHTTPLPQTRGDDGQSIVPSQFGR